MAAMAECERCGTENPADSERCVGCGRTLRAPKEVPEVPRKTRVGRREALSGGVVTLLLVLGGLGFVRKLREDRSRDRGREAREKLQRSAEERRRSERAAGDRRPPDPGDKGMLSVTAATFGATELDAFEDYVRATKERDDVRLERLRGIGTILVWPGAEDVQFLCTGTGPDVRRVRILSGTHRGREA